MMRCDGSMTKKSTKTGKTAPPFGVFSGNGQTQSKFLTFSRMSFATGPKIGSVALGDKPYPESSRPASSSKAAPDQVVT